MDLHLLLNWGPEKANKLLVLPFHHVQCLKKGFFFGHEHFVDVKSRCFLILRLKQETKLNESKKINLVILNPRCEEMPDHNTQVKWEFKKLKKSDIISFWFSEGSVNPITLFEYGSHFKSKKKIVVGCHPNYEKRNSVIVQTELERPKLKVQDNFEDFYTELIKTIKKLK